MDACTIKCYLCWYICCQMALFVGIILIYTLKMKYFICIFGFLVILSCRETNNKTAESLEAKVCEYMNKP